MELQVSQLQALSAAVAEGTLEAAARALHVTPSAVSQRLQALERATGRVLLVRSKPVRPTPSGEAVLRLARQLELLTADTAAELGAGDEAAVPVAIAVNADSLATWVLPALAPLADRVAFRFHRADEQRTAALLRSGEVVAAVTTEEAPVAGCLVTPLGRMRYRPVAAPAFAARWFPDGPTPEALAAAPVVVFDRDDVMQHRYLDRHAPGAAPPEHTVPSSRDFTAAIELGFGWGMLDELQLDPARVVDLAPGNAISQPLHWQRWRLRSPSLDAVSDAIVAAARARLR